MFGSALRVSSERDPLVQPLRARVTVIVAFRAYIVSGRRHQDVALASTVPSSAVTTQLVAVAVSRFTKACVAG